MKQKTIGILGGMGPLATVDLFQKIVSLTDASCDNEHIRVYIDSNCAIPDRTAAILSGGKDPVGEMANALHNLEQCGADCILLPCNTAHYFLPQLQSLTEIPFLSMPEVTAKACAAMHPGETAAILATRGTLFTRLYQNALTAEGVTFLVPDETQQNILMSVIYDGVKAGADPSTYQAAFTQVLSQLTEQGADYFLLGCTELPLVFSLLSVPVAAVDPTTELAKAAISYCGYRVRKYG